MLLRLLAAELGDITYLRPWDNSSNSGDLTLDMMERAGKNVIILYDDKNTIEGKMVWKSSKITSDYKTLKVLKFEFKASMIVCMFQIHNLFGHHGESSLR